MQRFLNRRQQRGVIVATLIALTLIPSHSARRAEARSDYWWTCQVTANFENRARYVANAPDTECSWPHSVPFGNWGISSNSGSQHDGHQFDGWCHNPSRTDCSSTWYEWNSCFSEHNSPNCDYYNATGCTAQISTSPYDVNSYGGYLVFNFQVREPSGDNSSGGCMDLAGYAFTSTGNFASLYEIDKYDWDDFVQTLYFSDTTASLSCDYAWYCEGESDWKSVTGRDPISGIFETNAMLRMRLSGTLIPPGGY